MHGQLNRILTSPLTGYKRDGMTDKGVIAGGGRLRVDLGAILQNYRAIASHVAPAEVGAVVKADAYGLGAIEVTRALCEGGCRLFFVAHLDEALRLHSIVSANSRLVVLNGLVDGAESICADAGIIPVLNSLEQAWRWRDTAQATGRRLPAILQFDSGMGRLGFPPEDLPALTRSSSFEAAIDLVMVMSHLACADTPDHATNAMQLARFTKIADHFPGVPRALANSGGAFLPPAFRCDIVRAGIALYGGAPNESAWNPMRPVVHLDARVIQTRTIAAGGHVGYGHDFRCDKDSRIATIDVGYADGLPRTLGNRGAAWFNDRRLPIVGRVSMDSITLDISALPPDSLRPGDWVELIGPNQSLDSIARDAQTISYEILTSLSLRYCRTYLASNAETRTRAA